MKLSVAFVIIVVVLAPGPAPRGAGAEDGTAAGVPREVSLVLGQGVVGAARAAGRTSSDPARLARWEAGEWTYLITSGPRRGEQEREVLAPIGRTSRGETWQRTIGETYTLRLSRMADGSLVMPSEIAHAHGALVAFDPPLSYLMADLLPGEPRVFEGDMDVYRVKDPSTPWYSGSIRATTVHAGQYRIRTPAGVFDATLIRTDYRIQIFGVVSVTDTLFTFYAEGIGKVAEAEHQRISAMLLFSSETRRGKVLVGFTPARRPTVFEAP